MDQVKIGKFIASCRKEQGMTQAALAEKLGITDRAVSKWETGKSLPDSGIMLELCELLNINVNELLSGEKIMLEAYDKKAEENLVAMSRELEEKNRQLLKKNLLSVLWLLHQNLRQFRFSRILTLNGRSSMMTSRTTLLPGITTGKCSSDSLMSEIVSVRLCMRLSTGSRREYRLIPSILWLIQL
jgi:transcriptional regulator with XRE-family HTH domain